MRCRTAMLLALVLLGAPLACDQTDDGNGSKIVAPDNNGNSDTDDAGTDPTDTNDGGQEDDVADLDAGTDAQPDGSADTSTSSDVEEVDDVDLIDTNRPDGGPGVSGSCEQVEDLGTLAFGTREFEFQFDGANDYVRTSCRDLGAESKPEKIYKFQVPQRGVLDLTANPNTVFELRTDPCGEEGSVATCNPNGSLSGYNLSEGVDYYLIVEFEAETVTGQDFLFDLTLNSVFTECGPGQTSCANGSAVQVCDEFGSYEEKTCPTSCSSSSCVGDSCANPIAVTSSATMSGDITAFSNKIRTFTTCGDTSSGVRLMDGQEVVFFAAGLRPGQTIDVDTSADSISNTIVIQRGACGASQACEHYDLAGGETLSHSVSRAGDYYVIIDSTNTAAGTADYSVSIN